VLNEKNPAKEYNFNFPACRQAGVFQSASVPAEVRRNISTTCPAPREQKALNIVCYLLTNKISNQPKENDTK
jgi:hypothetical protein